jgi:hypothetical protein
MQLHQLLMQLIDTFSSKKYRQSYLLLKPLAGDGVGGETAVCFAVQFFVPDELVQDRVKEVGLGPRRTWWERLWELAILCG